MNQEHKIPRELFIVEGEKIERILQHAVRQALLEHKRAGNTVAASKDGRVVLIPAEEIQVDEVVEGEQT